MKRNVNILILEHGKNSRPFRTKLKLVNAYRQVGSGNIKEEI
jgi:hypothetical protein